MHSKIEAVLRELVPATRDLLREEAEAFAPVNIALCKYWGKRDEELKLPRTGSLSVSMGDLGTHLRLRRGEQDRLHINGAEIPSDNPAFGRLFRFLDGLRPAGDALEVESRNTIPMAAGLASSASAFAAAVRAVERLYGWELTPSARSMLARLGSGSACRSVFEGFVEWRVGERTDGMDSYAEPLPCRWPEFRVGVLEICADAKETGSGEGMRRTVDTSALYAAWPDEVARDLPVIRDAVLCKDFPRLGRAAEQNALAMHATMFAAWPPLIYWRPETVSTLRQVQMLRREGVEVYATLDAGPNVKLLFLEKSAAALVRALPGLRVVAPFGNLDGNFDSAR